MFEGKIKLDLTVKEDKIFHEFLIRAIKIEYNSSSIQQYWEFSSYRDEVFLRADLLAFSNSDGTKEENKFKSNLMVFSVNENWSVLH